MTIKTKQFITSSITMQGKKCLYMSKVK